MADDKDTAALWERMKRWRHVQDECLKCRGSGVIQYSSGATWRGGMGTASTQVDVCDTCWGTGDRYRTGCDLRRLRDEEATRVAERAVTLVAESTGATFAICRPHVIALIGHLDKLVDKRGTEWTFQSFVNALANVLRRAVRMQERKL